MTIRSSLTQWAERNVGSAEADDEVVVKTTRYLRLSMVALVVGLAVAVLDEHTKSRRQGGGSGHCWQHSISAYYYTPVQSFFVGALVAIGISLIVLKGSTELEDLWLNFAGIFAPIVAFVPTPNVGTCGSALTGTTNRDLNIGNNVSAMLVMAGIALAVLGVLWAAGHGVTHTPNPAPQSNAVSAYRIAIGGYVLTFAFYATAWVLFLGPRKWFTSNAHSISAITMFVFIFLAVVNNAINFHFTRKKVVADQTLAKNSGADISHAHAVKPPKPINRYLVIAILMAAAVLTITLGPWFGDYQTIWLEASMISLFAVFWVIQTHELWHRGLRSPEQVATAVGKVGPSGELPGPPEVGQ